MKKFFVLISIIFVIAIKCSIYSSAQNIYFPPLVGNQWDTIPYNTLNWCPQYIDSLYQYLDTNGTKAFIFLKDGKIVLEKYFNGHTSSSVWQWASAGKTITSFMVGIAQQENYLNINDSTSKYLGAGWTSCLPVQESYIKIKNQLSMTSGLDDGVVDPYCTIDTCLIYKDDAGNRWAYHNAPYTILDQVIANATGQTLNDYTTNKLKNPTGMTGLFVPVGFNNVFFSNARSMARFGSLILNKGKWGNVPVLSDTSYFQQMINTSQPLNLSYGYLWWLNGKPSFMLPQSQFVFNGNLIPDAPSDLIIAMGKDGQFLNIVPSQNIVWIRMGNAPNALPVPYLMNNEIWKYINKLPCNVNATQDLLAKNNDINIYPIPCYNELHINSTFKVNKIAILNFAGQNIYEYSPNKNYTIINTSTLQQGLYLCKIELENGKIICEKITVFH